MSKKMHKKEANDVQCGLPYEHCLNCGTELKGKYCHSCGQEALDKTPSIGSFIHEYVDHAFKWDHKFFSTFWTLISRPGHLTNEFNAGKFVSQEHPLKLNMFLLLVFVTMFMLFSNEDSMKDSVKNFTNDERFYSALQLSDLNDNFEYVQKIKESPRDTVILKAPLELIKSFPYILTNVETIEDTQGKGVDTWMAVVPQVLIDDEIIIADENGCYHFNRDADISDNSLEIINSVWSEMTGIISHYFPIILLLTVPFLSLSLRLVQRKSKIPGICHFIFALHYTAFLESLMIFIYLLYLTIEPPMYIMELVMIIGSCIYLAVAYHKVYQSTWLKAIVKSMLTSFIYFNILLMIFIVIFIVACFIVIAHTI